MTAAITGWVSDGLNGLRIVSPDVRLYRIGVPGETCAALDENGNFSFSELSPGEYSVAVSAEKYVPGHRRIVLEADESIHKLHIALTSGGRISGRIVDEAGGPPKRCWFTLLREGERNGKVGYINSSGDHKVEQDGSFCSPPLAAGTYLLRFAGILQNTPTNLSLQSSPHGLMQLRVFDFLYPDAHNVQEARELQVQAGQGNPELQITIPCPTWYTVRGKVTGSLPEEYSRISVLFARDLGAVDQIGGASGARVQPDGSFEFMAQQGHYAAEICEFAPPDASGRTYVLRCFGTGSITVTDKDLSGVQFEIAQ